MNTILKLTGAGLGLIFAGILILILAPVCIVIILAIAQALGF